MFEKLNNPNDLWKAGLPPQRGLTALFMEMVYRLIGRLEERVVESLNFLAFAFPLRVVSAGWSGDVGVHPVPVLVSSGLPQLPRRVPAPALLRNV